MNFVSLAFQEIPESSWEGKAESFALRALETLGKSDWELSIVFCGDDFIQALNREYRNKDEPTDVLSFEMGETIGGEESERFLAGDIVISLPALERNRLEFSVTADEELKRLILHGILHLSGMDHESNEPDQPMLKIQEEILERLKGETIL